MIHIVTDSTCDLPQETVTRYKITVVPLYINQGDRAFLDGINLSREEFYRQLPGYKMPPTTATPGSEAFRQVYQRLAEQGAEAILSIHISETLSATVNAARSAAAQFTDIPVVVLDSSQLSLGTGFIVEKAAELAEAGHKMDQILLALQDVMKRTYVFASLKTMEYLRRSGRMNSTVARLGGLLQIKPLLYMNQGKPVAHRVRTQKRATERLLEWLNERAPFEKLAVVHAGIPEEAEAMRAQVAQFYPQGEIPVVQITPVLGAHLGVGALGFACVSKIS
jgi:DegV family protein with EDD domain